MSKKIVISFFLFISNLVLAQDLTLNKTRLIWKGKDHYAFTTFKKHNGVYYVAFRGGSNHKSFDGVIEVIKSKDLKNWEREKTLSLFFQDLRDPSFVINENNELILTAVTRSKLRFIFPNSSIAWKMSEDKKWIGPYKDQESQTIWRWGADNVGKEIVSVAYLGKSNKGTIFSSKDGINWLARKNNFFPYPINKPNESTIFKLEDDYIAILRQNNRDLNALIGRSKTLEGEWEWNSLGVRLASPKALVLNKDKVILAVRLYSKKNQRTSICKLDFKNNKLIELFALPSSGDTGYASFLREENKIYVTFYSSFSKNSNIYLSEITID